MIETIAFPDPRQAAEHGLVAIGGDFSPQRLLAAYASGIFPWPSEEFPRAWFSPDPRMVMVPRDLYVPRSLRKTLRRGELRVTWDTAFERVVDGCQAAPRPGQGGTWISDELRHGFLALHHLGFAHSVECWEGERLAGGLYGLSLGSMFCGESMFHRARDASKVAFVHLVRRLADWGFDFIDCQVYTDHLAQFGAREWRRDLFLDALARAIRKPTRRGSWALEDGAAAPASEQREPSSP